MNYLLTFIVTDNPNIFSQMIQTSKTTIWNSFFLSFCVRMWLYCEYTSHGTLGRSQPQTPSTPTSLYMSDMEWLLSAWPIHLKELAWKCVQRVHEIKIKTSTDFALNPPVDCISNWKKTSFYFILFF